MINSSTESSNYIGRKSAFTVVELIAVIVVLAILVAVSYAGYSSVQRAALSTAMRSELSKAYDVVELYVSDSGGRLPQNIDEVKSQTGLRIPETMLLKYVSYNDEYCLQNRSAKDYKHRYYVMGESGSISEGRCPAPMSINTRGSTCLSNNDTLYCWGRNSNYELGLGDSIQRNSPELVGGILEDKVIDQVSFSSSPTGNNVCLNSDGDLYCWGKNTYGRLGLGDTLDRNSPTLVAQNLSTRNIEEISTRYEHTCVIATGEVLCWGYNYYGQLGVGDDTARYVPTIVGGVISNEVAAHLSVGMWHSCVVTAEDRVYCWGRGSSGQLGLGDTTSYNAPQLVGSELTGKDVSSISSGNNHTCAIADNELYCWGDNSSGQLGLGDISQRNSPTKVQGSMAGRLVQQVSSGDNHTCAVSEGQLFCWGRGGLGQLGTGNTSNQQQPVLIQAALQGARVYSVSSSGEHTCALTSAGLYCWGNNSVGQLGLGDTLIRLTPALVELPV